MQRFILTITLIIGFLLLYTGSALAVKIIPPRLVIDSDVKVQHLFIKNDEKTTQGYRFGWKHLAMAKDGSIVNVDKMGRDKVPQYKAADDLIRFSPRRVTLKPGETQRITMMIRRSPSLDAGEYRSHFLIQRESQSVVSEQTSPDAPKEQGASVGVDVLISRAIPVYVLHGETGASIDLLSAVYQVNPSKKTPNQASHIVSFDVKKTGNRSVIGVANVYCNDSGNQKRLNKTGKVFAVYAEGEFGKQKMGVNFPPDSCANMKIKIVGHADDKLAGQVLAEGVLQRR
jgi:hypothetical protein